MNKRIKRAGAIAALAITAGTLLAGCTSDADTADQNIVTAAEQFEVQRTIVGMSGITDEIVFYAEGRCSFEDYTGRFDLTCKVADDEYVKNVFILGDQDRVVIVQEKPIDVSVYHTRIILKPESILPEFDIEVGKQ